MKTGLTILILLTTIIVKSQDKNVFKRSISVLEGLPAHTIFSLLSDSKGYIYLGTDQGLYRYNGINFQAIPMHGNNSNSISYLQEDADGNIWGMNFSRQIFYLSNGKLTVFPGFDSIYGEMSSLNDFIVCDTLIYTCSQKSVFVYNIRSKISSKITLDEEDSEHFLFSFFLRNRNEFLALSLSGSYFNIVDGRLKRSGLDSRYKNPGFRLGHGWGKPISIFFDSSAFTIAEFPSGKSYKINNLKPFEPSIVYFIRTINDVPYVCTSEGLIKIIKEGSDYKMDLLIESEIVSDFIVDYEGNHWISTLDNGLYFIPDLNTVSISNFKGDYFVRILSISDSTFIAGSKKGRIFKFDHFGNLQNEFITPKGLDLEFLKLGDDGTIYFDNGIIKKGEVTSKFYNDLGKDIAIDPFGNSLTAFGYGTYYFNPSSKIINRNAVLDSFFKAHQYFITPDKECYILNTSRCYSVIYSPWENSFYSANSNGLYRYGLNGASELILNHNGENIYASSLALSDAGELWVATFQEGVILMRNGEIINRFSVENGLSGNICKRIRIFNDSYVWVITQNGIDIIDPNSNDIKQLRQTIWKSNLIISDIYVSQSYVWLVTQEGLIQTPREYLPEIPNPRIFITQINVNGVLYSPPSITKLNYNENNLSFSFEGLCFGSKGGFTYRFRLNGEDTSWRVINAPLNTVNYLSLSPGNYSFEVKAVNHAGIESEVAAIIPFTILSPFWKHLWFISIEVLVVILILGYVLSRYQEKWKKKEKKILNDQITKEKINWIKGFYAFHDSSNFKLFSEAIYRIKEIIVQNKKVEAVGQIDAFIEFFKLFSNYSIASSKSLREEIDLISKYLILVSPDSKVETFSERLHSISIPTFSIWVLVEYSINLKHESGYKDIEICFIESSNSYHIAAICEDTSVFEKTIQESNYLIDNFNLLSSEIYNLQVGTTEVPGSKMVSIRI